MTTITGGVPGGAPMPPSPDLKALRRRAKKNSKGSRDVPTLILTAIVIVLLLALTVFPLIRVFTEALGERGWGVLTSMVSDSYPRQIIMNTLVLGVVVGLAGTLVGFLLAFAQVRLEFRGKRLLNILALIPIVAPPFAVATAVITLLGRNGIITNGLLGLTDFNIYGLKGMTLVLVLSFFPVSYMNFRGLLSTLDPSLEEAAADLGASKWNIFTRITLPLMLPGFAASFLLLFVEAIADLANPLVIGGNYTVLSSRAYIAFTGEYDIPAGAAYSLILLVPSILVFIVQQYWVGRKNTVTVTGKPAGKTKLITANSWRIPILTLVGLVMAVIITLYATVVIGSFVNILGVDNTWTLNNYRYVFSGIGNEAIIDTTLMALIATPIAAFLSMLIAWLVVRKLKRGKGILDFIGMLGLAVPGTVVGIGYAITFNNPVIFGGRMWLPTLGGGAAIFGGAIAIIMVYVIRSIPSGQRTAIATLQQISPSIEEASASLGANSFKTFVKVTLPLIRPALAAGLIYAFARAMTTLSPVIFLATPDVQIMTKMILAEVDAGRFGNAFAFSMVLLLIVITVIGLIELILGNGWTKLKKKLAK
ncbi:iron(III) transport system permease protein [Arcanobacterium wilhelmae]|uniref:Iron(III) transport system permease protein n=1 Tax=Arcanobacterium wilhelmae TaxID=1803177 RepID=A0ABT9N9B0_9ACTO|nr:iron ABC transporter permease [Arcanobacterium wilhelmae]MDP9800285.1 iron(III) transport system permease protein [Arcanobacterium wilhelmae]WFN89722.1 iron ABC transporter permease [Arcanobacterium wilhelmae]